MRLPPRRPLLYLITNRRAFRRASDQIEAIARAAEAGCDLIQIREKDLAAGELRRFTRDAIDAARPHGARVLVNDRVDVALAAGADGVHLRVSSLPARELRALPQTKDFLLGVSTHSMSQATEAAAAGADLIVCGPVYDTPSKREYGPPMGLQRFADICRRVSVPVLALGGITMANYAEPLRHGAAGLAAIGLFTDPNELAERIRLLRGGAA